MLTTMMMTTTTTTTTTSSGDGGNDYRSTGLLLLLFDLITKNSARRLGEIDDRSTGALCGRLRNPFLWDGMPVFSIWWRTASSPIPEDDNVAVFLCKDGFGLRKFATVLLAYARAGCGSRSEDAALFDDLAKAGIQWKEDLNNLSHYNN